MVEEAKKKSPQVNICCPTTYHAKISKINGKILDCLSPTSRDNSQNCESNWVMKQINILAIDHHYDFCIGPSWPTQTISWHAGLKMTRYGCKKPCNGKMPCLR